jgi:hypothetical protein
LNAIDGVAYLADADGTILAIGENGWRRFAVDNGAPWLTARSVIGSSLFAAISGDAVRNAFQRLHAAVASGRRSETVFEFQCNSPIAERHMRMSLTALVSHSNGVLVLYQSLVLTEFTSAPLHLFSSELRAPREQNMAARQTVSLCSFCQRVALAPEESARPRRWIDANDYYRRSGQTDVGVMDTVCPSCKERVVEANA